jgi:hypothetical protein
MVTVIILGLVIVILIYTNYNTFKKLERLEKAYDSQEKYINKVINTINYTDKRLDEIDEKGIFQADDEIGWFFESVKTLQRELNDFRQNGRK